MTQVAQKRKKVPVTGNINNKIIILSKDGNLVCEESNDVIKPLGLIEDADILRVLSKKQSVTTGIMNKNTIYYERFIGQNNQVCHMVVLEFDPQVYTINQKFEYAATDDQYFTYRLGLPYVQFYACIKEYNGLPTLHNYATITCTKKSIKTEKDPVFALFLHNLQNSSGNICWGNAAMIKAEKETAASYVRKLYNHFFTLRFNCHLKPKWPTKMLADSGLKSYDVYGNPKAIFDFWDKETAKDPKFILEYDYLEYHKNDTFETIVKRTKDGT